MDYIYRTEIPEDYITITSGILGDQKPRSLLLIPLISDEKLQGVIEFASLDDFIPNLTIRLLKELGEIIARTFSNLKINERTEKLLVESQQMTLELQENEEELRQNAEEMRATQEELKKSNEHLETQIQEVENAQKRQYSLLENASEKIAIYNEKMVMKYESP
jgi:transcriptional regulator with GAF, ATPase, and Fis domain